jgi:O-antigen/teichoic acid export membrane protein
LSAIYFRQVNATTLIKILSIIISIIYIPLVLGFLDQEKYGIWVTLTTIINWIRLLDIGMGNGMRNKLAEAVALKQNDPGRVYVSTTYGIIGMIFLAVIILFHFINPYLNWQLILNTGMITSSELTDLAAIVFTMIVLAFVLQPVSLIYAAHGNSAAGGIIQLIISSLTLLLIWLASIFAEKGNLILLAWIVTGVPILVYLIVSVYTFIYKYPHLTPSIKQVRISESANLIRLSVQFFIVQITATIIYASIPFVVAQLFSPNEVTVFSIANSIFNLPVMVISLFTTPILPLVTQAFAREDYIWIRSMLRKLMKFSLVIVSGTVLMIFISPFIYHIWIGDKVSIPFGLSAAIGIYAVLNILLNPISTFINGIGKIRLLTILSPVGILLFVGCSILFSRLFDNVIGVSVALSLSSILGLIVLPAELQKYIGKTGRILRGRDSLRSVKQNILSD